MPICCEIYYKILSTVAVLNWSCIFSEDDIIVPKHVAVRPVFLYVYNIMHLVGCRKRIYQGCPLRIFYVCGAHRM